MRRGIKFSKKAYTFLTITAFFTLLSIIFDQLVVQQEDKIRAFDKEISGHKIEVNSLLYAHKVFDELMFKVHFSAANLVGDLNYLTRTINYLNSKHPEIFKGKTIGFFLGSSQLPMISELEALDCNMAFADPYFLMKTPLVIKSKSNN